MPTLITSASAALLDTLVTALIKIFTALALNFLSEGNKPQDTYVTGVMCVFSELEAYL